MFGDEYDSWLRISDIVMAAATLTLKLRVKPNMGILNRKSEESNRIGLIPLNSLPNAIAMGLSKFISDIEMLFVEKDVPAIKNHLDSNFSIQSSI